MLDLPIPLTYVLLALLGAGLLGATVAFMVTQWRYSKKVRALETKLAYTIKARSQTNKMLRQARQQLENAQAELNELRQQHIVAAHQHGAAPATTAAESTASKPDSVKPSEAKPDAKMSKKDLLVFLDDAPTMIMSRGASGFADTQPFTPTTSTS